MRHGRSFARCVTAFYPGVVVLASLPRVPAEEHDLAARLVMNDRKYGIQNALPAGTSFRGTACGIRYSSGRGGSAMQTRFSLVILGSVLCLLSSPRAPGQRQFRVMPRPAIARMQASGRWRP